MTDLHPRALCPYPAGCTGCSEARPFVLWPRNDGGWWVMRHPDDRTGDVAGYSDGYVRQVDAGWWLAVSWDGEDAHVARDRDVAAQGILDARWAIDVPDLPPGHPAPIQLDEEPF